MSWLSGGSSTTLLWLQSKVELQCWIFNTNFLWNCERGGVGSWGGIVFDKEHRDTGSRTFLVCSICRRGVVVCPLKTGSRKAGSYSWFSWLQDPRKLSWWDYEKNLQFLMYSELDTWNKHSQVVKTISCLFSREHMQLLGNSSHLVSFLPFLVKWYPLFCNFLFIAVFIAISFCKKLLSSFAILIFLTSCSLFLIRFSPSQLWRREWDIQAVLSFSPLRFLVLWNHYTHGTSWRENSAKHKQTRKLLKCTDKFFLKPLSLAFCADLMRIPPVTMSRSLLKSWTVLDPVLTLGIHHYLLVPNWTLCNCSQHWRCCQTIDFPFTSLSTYLSNTFSA